MIGFNFMFGTIGINFTPEMITDMLGYVADVFADLSLPILLIVGVGLGLIVVGALVKIFHH